MNIAIVGCTGLVGRKIIEIIEERSVRADEIYLFASAESQGKMFSISGKPYVVETLTPEAVLSKKTDVALFAAGKDISKVYAPLFTETGAYVIDNSSAFRMLPGVPLVVPEVNPADIETDGKIIANPNCSTIQAMLVLKPLDEYVRLKRVLYATYQAVSGVGQKGINDLNNGAKGVSPKKFPRQIFSNCIPQVDDFGANGYTFEEDKMINETRKILNRPDLAVTATCVRVPVYNCHSEFINVEFENEYDLDTVRSVLSKAKGVKVYENDYPTACDANGSDKVLVGRIRRDNSVKNGLNLWCVADNVRKGAATNAVQILQLLIKSGKIK